MTDTDRQYLDLLKDILENGVEKDTRAGRVKSVFGRQLRFDLKEGIPLLTTKKVFTKGVIHELLWFLQRPYNSHGSMNIEYLVRNGVHIWDDDAYRWFKQEIVPNFKPKQYMVCLDENDDEIIHNCTRGVVNFEHWIEGESRLKDENWLQSITKEEFLDLTLQRVEMWGSFMSKYRFGDLGPIYGAQWSHFGDYATNQIHDIIQMLKTNPNDRRMICLAWNPNKLKDMALPPCHVMFQFYTRELTNKERMKIFNERYAKGEIPQKYNCWLSSYAKDVSENQDIKLPDDGSGYDAADIPRYGLSCMWVQRSCDCPLGIPYNILSYSMLTYMIARLVNMVPDELVGSLGDCHIYLNQVDGIKEQISRNGSDIVPKLIINGEHCSVADFKYEDFEIKDYYPDPIIRFPLSVGG